MEDTKAILARFDVEGGSSPTQTDIENWRTEAKAKAEILSKKKGYIQFVIVLFMFLFLLSISFFILSIAESYLAHKPLNYFKLGIIIIISASLLILQLFEGEFSTQRDCFVKLLKNLRELSEKDDSDVILALGQKADKFHLVGMYLKKIVNSGRLPLVIEEEKIGTYIRKIEIKKRTEKTLKEVKATLSDIKNLETE